MTSPYTRGRVALGLTFPSVLAVLAFASTASAEQECGEFTCADGFICNTIEADEGETFYSCDRAPCDTDAECGDFMVCGTFEIQCPELLIACEEGEECAAAPECEASEFSQCAPRWDLPCSADADCGEGFQCEKTVCDCSDVAVSRDSDEPLEEPACNDCYEADEGWCNYQEVECEQDADCPADWNCAEAGLVRCDEDGTCDDGNSLTCQPPWDKVNGPSNAILEVATSGLPQTNTAGLGDPAVAEADGTTADGAATDADDPMSVVNDDDDVAGSPNDGPNASSGGCTVTDVTGSRLAGLGWLGLALGLVFGARRRRS